MLIHHPHNDQGPYRHYILNALWILINLLCIILTLYQVILGWINFVKAKKNFC